MNKYLLYYAGFDRANGLEQIGAAVSDDLRAWRRAGAVPILPVGSAGAADAAQTSNPCVLFSDGLYRMWYQGRDAQGRLSVCYAQSSDGLSWRAREGAVLAVPPDTALEHRLGFHHPHVIYDEEEGRYKIWCTRYRGGRAEILYGESVDGIEWSLEEGPVFQPEAVWEGHRIFYPCVRKEGRVYRMWYTGIRVRDAWFIGYAESKDGRNWQRKSAPIWPLAEKSRLLKKIFALLSRLRVFPRAGLDVFGAASPCVWREDGEYRMLAHDVAPAGKLSISLYGSSDGLAWRKRKSNILGAGAQPWESFFQADPYIIRMAH